MDTIKPLYTATATAVGGRNGHPNQRRHRFARSVRAEGDGRPGQPGTATPEHLFAAGYAACFGGAIDFVAKQHKQDAANAQVTCAVSIGPRDGGGFGLAVKMRVEDKSLKQAELVNLVKEAHEKICPYSTPRVTMSTSSSTRSALSAGRPDRPSFCLPHAETHDVIASQTGSSLICRLGTPLEGDGTRSF